MAAPIIWINAFPGTGKLTVATALTSLHSPILVIDNHQLIDPVASKYSRDHPDYQPERKREREKAFSKYVSGPAWVEHTIVFTGGVALLKALHLILTLNDSPDFQTTDKLGSSVAREYKAAAEAAGRPFVPICLICSVETNIERATSDERIHGQTTKLTDTKVLRNFRDRSKLFQFEIEGFESCLIDTSTTVPTDVAKDILDYCYTLGLYRKERNVS